MKRKVRVTVVTDFEIEFDGRKLSPQQAVKRVQAEHMSQDSFYWSAIDGGISTGPAINRVHKVTPLA